MLIRVRYCSVCGSDVRLFKIGPEIPRALAAVFKSVYGGDDPLSLLGHQFCGEVAEVGSGVKEFKVGDRVVARGAGAYAEYVAIKTRLMERKMVFSLPNEITYEQASLIEPLSIAVDIIRRCSLKLGDVVVILGAGPLGLFILQCAKASGAKKIYVTETSDLRIKKARELGADEVINPMKDDPLQKIYELTSGLGPDIVFDCAGKSETLRQMIAMLPRRGKGIIVASYEKTVEIDLNAVMLKSLNIIGALAGWPPEDWEPRSDPFEIAIDFIKTGRVSVDPLITSIVALENINKAFMALLKGEQVAVLIKP